MADSWGPASDDAIDGRLDAKGSAGGATDGCAGKSSDWLHFDGCGMGREQLIELLVVVVEIGE